ncbi:hypothetical protein MVES1_002575 [Malassezia vespertilionis]|uniref:Uncharacterized protein n=1 Tax=Malassezia vespertilionis TaxID=2020962 RepID=A0A2N1JA86_9BASI|nr:uncharacterized protein MVES1_002575 [Malassezia vespertilionis]PKI83443.1 hypothetical protein MVES_002432 [Malassezia vespertilionis]WFD07216.1 hypothetical protein MVES1_002575 [Malassezia vespertilionis]
MHPKYDAMRAATLVMYIIAGIIAIALDSVLSVLISQPIYSGFVHFRANYTPKAVALPEGDATDAHRVPWYKRLCRTSVPRTGPAVHGVLSMISRVVSLEGWRSLYQGATVYVAQTFVTTSLFLAAFFLLMALSTYGYNFPVNNPFAMMGAALFVETAMALLVLPFLIVLQRSMVHPYRLNWFRPRESLQSVLSEAEYTCPARLYCLPGVVSAPICKLLVMHGAQFAFHGASAWSGVQPALLRLVLLKGPAGKMPPVPAVSARELLGYAMFVFVLVLATVPFDCALVRLATQRTASRAYRPADSAAPQGETQAPLRECTPRLLDQAGEPSISLRPGPAPLDPGESYFGASSAAPYGGLVDCMRKMAEEEGCASLWRGATLTFLAMCVGNAGAASLAGVL